MILNATIQALDGRLWVLKKKIMKKYPVLTGLVKELGRQNQVSYIILSKVSKIFVNMTKAKLFQEAKMSFIIFPYLQKKYRAVLAMEYSA